MQMATVIKIRNLFIHNKLGDERNTVISRVDKLIKPSSTKYALFPVSVLHPPSSAYLALPLNSTLNYVQFTGLSVLLTFKGREFYLYMEKC